MGWGGLGKPPETYETDQVALGLELWEPHSIETLGGADPPGPVGWRGL